MIHYAILTFPMLQSEAVWSRLFVKDEVRTDVDSMFGSYGHSSIKPEFGDRAIDDWKAAKPVVLLQIWNHEAYVLIGKRFEGSSVLTSVQYRYRDPFRKR